VFGVGHGVGASGQTSPPKSSYQPPRFLLSFIGWSRPDMRSSRDEPWWPFQPTIGMLNRGLRMDHVRLECANGSSNTQAPGPIRIRNGPTPDRDEIGLSRLQQRVGQLRIVQRPVRYDGKLRNRSRYFCRRALASHQLRALPPRASFACNVNIRGPRIAHRREDDFGVCFPTEPTVRRQRVATRAKCPLARLRQGILMSLITSLICNWTRAVTCAEFP
jgi:hypothetical protein